MTDRPSCPKCGGTAGYSYVLVMRHEMLGTWGSEAESGKDETVSKPVTVECMDCRKRVDMVLAASDDVGMDTGARIDGKVLRSPR